MVSVLAGAQNMLLPLVPLNSLTTAKLHEFNNTTRIVICKIFNKYTNRIWSWPEPSGGAVQVRVTDDLCSLFV